MNGVNSTWTGLNQKFSSYKQDNTRSSIPVHGNLFGSGSQQSYNYSERDNRYKRNRYYKCLYAIIGFSLFLPQYANAEAVGGVSATAIPVANSSGSVTNQDPGSSGTIYHQHIRRRNPVSRRNS